MRFSFLMYDPVPDLNELDRRMGRIAALGYAGIELTATHPLGYPIESLVELTQRHRLPVVSLLSGWSYANEGLCLSSPKADVRQRAVERLVEYIGHAARLRSIVVLGLMQGLRADESDEQLAGRRILACLRQVAEVAVRQGVKVVIEPVNHLQVGIHHTAAEVAALVSEVASPGLGGLGYMLDTIHMNIEERSLLETIRTHGGRIGHFHLCETNGGPFGSGGLDFPAVLAALRQVKYDGFVSVKIYRRQDWAQAAESAAEFLGLVP